MDIGIIKLIGYVLMYIAYAEITSILTILNMCGRICLWRIAACSHIVCLICFLNFNLQDYSIVFNIITAKMFKILSMKFFIYVQCNVVQTCLSFDAEYE